MGNQISGVTICPRTYLIYVDESGDPGILQPDRSNSQHYILSGVIIPVDRWRVIFEQHRQIRYYLKQAYGLPVRTEIHIADWLGRNRSKQKFHDLMGNKKNRVATLRDYIQRIALDLIDIQFIHVHVNKVNYRKETPINLIAWERLIQRFHNFLEYQRFEGITVPANGMIFADQNDEPMLRRLLRKMRAYNPVPNLYGGGTRQKLCTQIVDDPVIRDSKHSYFVQMVDVSAYLLYQKLYPRGSLKRYNVDRLFDLLHPRLLLEASRKDPYGMGIVHV